METKQVNVQTCDQLRRTAESKHALLLRSQSHLTLLRTHLAALEAVQKEHSTCEHAAVTALAQSECRTLCAAIQATLPRELRDMIYTHLVPASTLITREYFRSTLDPATKLHTYDTHNWRETQYPEHWWDARFVGDAVLREVLVMYYRSSVFAFGGDDEGLVDRFLSTDMWNAGFVPRQLVGAVEVRLSAVTYDRNSCVGYFFGSPTKPEKLVAAMRGVEKIKPGAEVSVFFDTKAKDEEARGKQVDAARKALGPVLEALREKGVKAEILVDRKRGEGEGVKKCVREGRCC